MGVRMIGKLSKWDKNKIEEITMINEKKQTNDKWKIIWKA